MTSPDPEAVDLELGPPAGREPPHGRGSFEVPVPVGLAPPSAPGRVHGPWVAWMPYLLIIGPETAWCLLMAGFVLGVVSAGVAVSANDWENHAVAATTALAGLYWLEELWRRRREGGRLARIPRPVLITLTVATCGVCFAVILDAARLDGGGLFGQCAQAAVVLLWCPLLIPAVGDFIARRPDGSHAPAARRAAAVCMAGLVLAGIALTLTSEFLVHHESYDMLYRQYELNTDPAFQGTPIPTAIGVGGVLAACGYCVSNAILEEFVFAVLVLGLERARWKKGWIIAVAFLARGLMHLYYGPSGMAGGIFGAANAYALLRWRRLVPIIAMHALFDAISSVAGDNNLFPSGLVAYLVVQALTCAVIVAVLAAVDKLARPGSARAPRAIASAARRVLAR